MAKLIRLFKGRIRFENLVGVALLFLLVSCSKSEPPQTVSGPIETNEARVASRYGGRVEKILAREGDELKAGQSLIELDAEELFTQKTICRTRSGGGAG